MAKKKSGKKRAVPRRKIPPKTPAKKPLNRAQRDRLYAKRLRDFAKLTPKQKRSRAAKKGHETRKKIAKKVEREKPKKWHREPDNRGGKNLHFANWTGPELDEDEIEKIVKDWLKTHDPEQGRCTGTLSWIDGTGQHFLSVPYREIPDWRKVVEDLSNLLLNAERKGIGPSEKVDPKRVVYYAFTITTPETAE